MRITSFLLAVLVSLFIYVFLFERDFLLEIVGVDNTVITQDVKDENASNDDISADEPFEVSSIRSTARKVETALVVYGVSEASRQVDVRAETAGLVVSEPLRKGMKVEKDGLLCEIDFGTRASTLARAHAALVEAEARFEEAKINKRAASELLERGFGSETGAKNAEAILEAARAGITSARAGIANAEKDIENLKIRAPFSGFLERDTAELGSLLQPGAHCATIIQLDPIKFAGFVPEKEIANLSVGSKVVAQLLSGDEIKGEVSFISRSADKGTRTFRLEAVADNPDWAISDGQTVRLSIEIENNLWGHELPQSALTLDDSGKLGVMADRGGIATFLPVEIVRDTFGAVWVTGLKRKENVIILGQDFVLDGGRVKSFYGDPS